LLLFQLPGLATASASPSSALREYKDGQYDKALQDYQQLLEKKKDDPRLHFNAGTAAYKNQQFDEAIKQFNEALTAQDLNLQSLAYYNRGNSLFWMGQQNPDPGKKTEAWEKSLKDFESSAKLNPDDKDAKFNHEFVKKMLEELKKQQQQQQKNQQQDLQPSEAAKQAKAQADEAVHRRDYAKALEIMDSQLQKDPTTAFYNDFIQRLKEINGVQTSAAH
jgi:Ca-activated chloride channel family protein